PYFDKDHLLVPLTVGYQSYILVNSDLVKEGQIKSYADLLDPKWKGKIVLFDPTTGGGSGINWVTFVLKHALGVEEGKKFFQSLMAQQEMAVTRDGRLQVEGLARGKYAIAIAPTVSLVSEFIASGAPLKWARLQEGGSLAPAASVIGLVEKPAHASAGVVMVNWLLSTEGQRAFSREFGQPATRLGVSTEGIDPGRVPIPGEKAYLADEDFTVFSKDTSIGVAREVFSR
ncbi:MAG: extracellular solute-binding protein, partial [Chloroflexi bacterium]|nr:extracellular solute-binding protein [Chloroflexota bacterium]